MKNLSIVLGLILFAFFLILGLIQIHKSDVMYRDSQNLTNSIMKVFNSTTGTKPTVIQPSYSIIKDGYGAALTYFMLGLGVIILAVLLPRLQNINISTSGINLALKDLPEKVDNLSKQLNAAQTNSVGSGGIIKDTNEMNLPKNFALIKGNPRNYTDDPQKGKWGGKNKNNGRELKADILTTATKGIFEVKLTVISTSDGLPLNGLVKFHLHDTFNNPNPIISVQNNKAILNLNRVYGAFTVGAEADDGKTQLELDLAELKLGDEFKSFLES